MKCGGINQMDYKKKPVKKKKKPAKKGKNKPSYGY
jgi:hypothetical protein|tara:strand:+ start:2668 stop:2772 length:105 start_codon:yes stop_codon:yes gene_type:complete